MVRKRRIEPLDMESKLSSDIVQERKIIEQDFAEKKDETSETIDRNRVLFLASSGEVAIAKSVIFEKLRFNLSDEYMLETIALVETYEMNQHESEYWLNNLLQLFPNNEIGGVIRIIKSAEVSKKWEVVFEKSKVILSEDGGNWFALLAAAKSNAAIGDWEVSAKYWDTYAKLRSLSPQEVYDSSRSYYNSKRFESVVGITSRNTNWEEREEKILELIIRSHYNLNSDDLCVEFSELILEINSKSEVGLRFQSRSLVRLGRISDSIPIMRKYCELSPTSVDAWESLLEAQLMMDRVEETRETWNYLKEKIGNDFENFLTAIEIAIRFHWRDEYKKILDEGAERYAEISTFSERIAEINLNVGDIGRAWGILNSYGQNPLKSLLSERFLDIINKTKTEKEEIQRRADLGKSMWITELVTRELLRKSGKRRAIGKKPYRCHLVSSSLDRGGAERQVAMTLKHMTRERKFLCSLSVHRIENVKGSGTYIDELGGMEDSIFDLSEINPENKSEEVKAILIQNEDLLNLLDSGVRKKIQQLIIHFSDQEFDLVHAWQDETILTCAIAGALTGVPRILGSARSLRPDEKTELHIRKRPYLKNCFIEIFDHEENFLSTNSIAGLKSYSEWIGMEEAEIQVNYNGVDFEEIESRMKPESISKILEQFEFSEENRIVGGLFRLEPGKRPELWLEAFEYCRKEDQTLRGIIVGGGRMESSLREWVKDSGLDMYVKIIGETDDVGGWLNEMDIFLYTSITEGLPNVIIEAQGFGVPVVSTSVGGIPEIVNDGETGVLVDSSSGEVLGKQIIKLMGEESFSEMGEASKIEARGRFSISNMVSGTCEMYSRVLARP